MLKSRYARVEAFTNEQEGMEYVNRNDIDVLLMHLDLVPVDAVTLTKEIAKRDTLKRPFIVIYSEKQDDFVHEIAFNSGADSFISFYNKPAILALFIDNLLLRRKKEEPAVDTKGVSIDTERFVVLNKGEAVQLPRKEFRIFELLYSNPQKFFTKQDIAQAVWNDKTVADRRIIDVHVYNIRKVFGKRIIQSRKGKGYRFNSKLL